ncbi:MAG: 23S rRNA (pseudouridine(1915)-N(3))-methyltransferase RlmH, partial [Bacteroidales bacterium]
IQHFNKSKINPNPLNTNQKTFSRKSVKTLLQYTNISFFFKTCKKEEYLANSHVSRINKAYHFIVYFCDKKNRTILKIKLIVTGKTEEPYLEEGIAIYLKRLKHYTNFEITILPNIKTPGKQSKEQILKKESENLLKQIGRGDFCILLDERGKSMRSLEFASFIEEKLQQSIKQIIFIVGGAYGFAPELYKRADMKLSLSKMTFSHQMIRLFFVEQLYRAFSIIKNEPYHNE